MAYKDIKDKGFDSRTTEEQQEIARKGGIASGKARQEKATMKATLEMLLNEKNKKGITYKEMATLGLIQGAIKGNAQNYRVILETLGELKQIEEDRTQREISKVEELLIKLEVEAKNDIKQ